MNFSCPACQAKYFVRDEDVLGRTLKLRCRKCQDDIPIQGRRPGDEESGAPPRSISSDRLALSLPLELSMTKSEASGPASARPSLPPPLPADPSEGEFYVAVRGAPVGPLDADEVAERAERGEIGPRTYVWRPGQTTWQRLSQVPEFAYLLARVSLPPPLFGSEPDPLPRTLEERLGFGYLGDELVATRSLSAAAEKRVRLASGVRRPNARAQGEWTSLFVGLVISIAVGVALGAML